MGICYARKTGLPLLVNRKMYHLSLEITGSALQNVKQFWETIEGGDLLEGCLRVKTGEEPVLLLADGTAWTFKKEYVRLENEELVQMFAIDTTDLYKLSLELNEKNISLKEMNQRLQDHSENVTELTREEEILATKVKIHADMGSALMATRYYLNKEKIL
jgi:FtsZ-binding cell division protein ZapB